MRKPLLRNDHSLKSALRQLDRVSGEINRVSGAINPYLVSLAVGLFILNLVCFVALAGSGLPIMRMSLVSSTSPSPGTSNVGTVALPSATAAARSSP